MCQIRGMSKSSSRRVSHKSFFVILILSLVISICYVAWKTYFRPLPSSIDVFVVSPAELSFGNTTLLGTLRKDSPVGIEGKYILVLKDGRPIVLDIKGLDNLIGLPVTVSGNLSPSDSSHPMSMVVSSIEATLQ